MMSSSPQEKSGFINAHCHEGNIAVLLALVRLELHPVAKNQSCLIFIHILPYHYPCFIDETITNNKYQSPHHENEYYLFFLNTQPYFSYLVIAMKTGKLLFPHKSIQSCSRNPSVHFQQHHFEQGKQSYQLHPRFILIRSIIQQPFTSITTKSEKPKNMKTPSFLSKKFPSLSISLFSFFSPDGLISRLFFF